MATKKIEAGNLTCGACGAENLADYTFCFACRATPSTGGAKKTNASKKTSAKAKKKR